MPSIITDKRFQDVTDYPSIRQDYAHTFKSMKKMKFDLWLASHASHFDLQRRHPSGSGYNPAAFMVKKDFFTELNDLEKTFKDKEKKDGKGYPGKQSQITSISTYYFSPSAPRHSKRPNDSNNNRDRYSNHNDQHNVVELGF